MANPLTNRICRNCERPITDPRKLFYCSNKCRGDFYNKKYKEKNPEWWKKPKANKPKRNILKVCLECGTPFTDNRKKRFCHPKCRIAYSNRKNKKEMDKIGKFPKYDRAKEYLKYLEFELLKMKKMVMAKIVYKDDLLQTINNINFNHEIINYLRSKKKRLYAKRMLYLKNVFWELRNLSLLEHIVVTEFVDVIERTIPYRKWYENQKIVDSYPVDADFMAFREAWGNSLEPRYNAHESWICPYTDWNDWN